MSDHTFLVAFTVADPFDNYTREDAENYLMDNLPPAEDTTGDRLSIESWWVAEDDRHDRSDDPSALFVYPGTQVLVSHFLHHHQLTPEGQRVYARDIAPQFGGERMVVSGE